MKTREIIIVLSGLAVGILGTLGGARLGRSQAAPTAAPDVEFHVVPDAKPAAPCVPGCNPYPCKPGSTLTCFGCGFNGGNQQLTGERLCNKRGEWGSCSTGAPCSL